MIVEYFAEYFYKTVGWTRSTTHFSSFEAAKESWDKTAAEYRIVRVTSEEKIVYE